jgi:TonB family protein
VTPPTIRREVRPDYTNEARRLAIEGDVDLEIVVRADGSVGPIRIVRGLEPGLDRNAVAAVRQWRFDPARREGTPVDVIVQVSVAFTLR